MTFAGRLLLVAALVVTALHGPAMARLWNYRAA